MNKRTASPSRPSPSLCLYRRLEKGAPDRWPTGWRSWSGRGAEEELASVWQQPGGPLAKREQPALLQVRLHQLLGPPISADSARAWAACKLMSKTLS